MINRNTMLPALAILASAILTCGAQSAHALNLDTHVQSISQSGTSPLVNLGHVVSASSSMNRLYAAGAFEARCVSTYTGAISDQRGLPAESFFGGTQLTVTVPAWLPAVRAMPGFEQVPAGTVLSCSYNWTSEAEESTYTIGVPGFGITIGGQKARDGRSVPFIMTKPAGDADSDNGCIH